MTPEEIAGLRPAREVLPAAFFEHVEEERRRRGRPATGHAKEAVTLRLDGRIIEAFKRRAGDDWRQAWPTPSARPSID